MGFTEELIALCDKYDVKIWEDYEGYGFTGDELVPVWEKSRSAWVVYPKDIPQEKINELGKVLFASQLVSITETRPSWSDATGIYTGSWVMYGLLCEIYPGGEKKYLISATAYNRDRRSRDTREKEVCVEDLYDYS